MSLEQTIHEICDQMQNEDWSEADIEDYAVRPLLLALGWPDQREIIRRQYPLDTGKVDLALRHPETKKPLVFIEAKNSKEKLEKHEKQLLKYAFAKGTPLTILTNGKIWKFYYSQAEADWTERCFCVLNICEDDREKSTFTLDRYLNFHTVVDNVEEFKDVIRKDCQRARAEEQKARAEERAHREKERAEERAHREIEKTLPEAWQKIVNDTLLIELLRETVKEMCDYQPTEERAQAFLKELSVPAALHRALPSQGTTLSPVSSTEARGFLLNGRRYYANSGIAILVGVLNELINLNPSFAERFVKSDFNFNFRRNWYKYLSKNPDNFQYPDRVKRLDSGWWINRNLSIKMMDDIIQEACKIVELKYVSNRSGRLEIAEGEYDLIVHFPPEKASR